MAQTFTSKFNKLKKDTIAYIQEQFILKGEIKFQENFIYVAGVWNAGSDEIEECIVNKLNQSGKAEVEFIESGEILNTKLENLELSLLVKIADTISKI